MAGVDDRVAARVVRVRVHRLAAPRAVHPPLQFVGSNGIGDGRRRAVSRPLQLHDPAERGVRRRGTRGTSGSSSTAWPSIAAASSVSVHTGQAYAVSPPTTATPSASLVREVERFAVRAAEVGPVADRLQPAPAVGQFIATAHARVCDCSANCRTRRESGSKPAATRRRVEVPVDAARRIGYPALLPPTALFACRCDPFSSSPPRRARAATCRTGVVADLRVVGELTRGRVPGARLKQRVAAVRASRCSARRARSCTECQSLRVPVAAFHPDRSQRRACAANDGEVRLVDRHARPSRRASSPCTTASTPSSATRRAGRTTARRTPPTTSSRSSRTRSTTQEWCYYLGDKLVGVGYVDRLPEGLSAIYFFHDPDERHRSLGTFNVLSVIRAAAAPGCRTSTWATTWRAAGRWSTRPGSARTRC